MRGARYLQKRVGEVDYPTIQYRHGGAKKQQNGTRKDDSDLQEGKKKDCFLFDPKKKKRKTLQKEINGSRMEKGRAVLFTLS